MERAVFQAGWRGHMLPEVWSSEPTFPTVNKPVMMHGKEEAGILAGDPGGRSRRIRRSRRSAENHLGCSTITVNC